MLAFRELAEFIASQMGEKFSPKIIKMASLYKKLVEKDNKGINSIEATKKAKDLFLKDSSDNRKKKLAESEVVRKSKNNDNKFSATSDE